MTEDKNSCIISPFQETNRTNIMDELKEFFKQEFDNFYSQIHNFWFFLGVILSMSFILVGLNWAFSDSDADREMRKPSIEYKDKYSGYKSGSVHITNFYQKCKGIE